MDSIHLHVTNYIFNKFKNNTKKDEFRPLSKFYKAYIEKYFIMFNTVKNYKCELFIYNAYTSEKMTFNIKNIEIINFDNLSNDAKAIYREYSNSPMKYYKISIF